MKTTFLKGDMGMASSVHVEKVNVGVSSLWPFLLDKESWATLIPGYLHHELKSENEMIWVFKGNFGIVEKAVKVELKVTEIIENEKISFDLIGLSDNINGNGYYEISQLDDGTCQLSGCLDMKAGGFLAAMINPVLENFVPKTTEELVKEMANHITQTAV